MTQLTILSLGWGVQSFTLAAMVALKELPPVDYAVHADTTHEAAGTYAHAAQWTPWLEEHGVKVVTVHANRPEVVRQEWGVNGSVLIPAFTQTKQLGDAGKGQVRRQCTHDWKIMPIRRFIRTLRPRPKPGEIEMWMGISLDEWERMRSSDVAYINNVYPLVNSKVTREGCVAWLNAHHLEVPPKSGCTFCPYNSLGRWKRLKQEGGPDWVEAVAVDQAIRLKRPGYTLFVHPHRKPLAEAVSIPEDVGAHQLELEIPCDGGICHV